MLGNRTLAGIQLIGCPGKIQVAGQGYEGLDFV